MTAIIDRNASTELTDEESSDGRNQKKEKYPSNLYYEAPEYAKAPPEWLPAPCWLSTRIAVR
jgi:hypothetical protein